MTALRSLRPPAPITRHRLTARRTVVVWKPDEHGEPDTTTPAYALNRVDLGDRCTYLRSNEIDRREFNEISVVHPPAAALPRWARWLGLERSDPLLVWGAHPLTPDPSGLLQGLGMGALCTVLGGVVLLAGLAWWHLPARASLADVATSRYAVAAAALLAAWVWNIAMTRAGRLQADASQVHRYFRYRLGLAPTGLKAGIASVGIGGKVFQVLQGKADEVVHWLHPGPEIDGAHHSFQSRFRCRVDGREVEGQTRRQSHDAQPFIVPGDLLRMVVEPPAEPGGRTRVLALANLSDGHLLFDETDDRIAGMAIQGAGPAILSMLALLALLVAWLGFGPDADGVSWGLLGLCVVLATWSGVAMGLRRRRRAAVARALGAQVSELQRRSLTLEPLPMTYF